MIRFFTVGAFLLFLLVATSFAQNTISIKGYVQDKNNKPLQSVSITLLRLKDSALIKTAVTDARGSFEINSKKEGSYLLSYTMVGFEKTFIAAPPCKKFITI